MDLFFLKDPSHYFGHSILLLCFLLQFPLHTVVNGQFEPIIQRCSVKSISPSLAGNNLRIPPSFMWNNKYGLFRLREHELNCKMGHFEVLIQKLLLNKTSATVFTVDKNGDEESHLVEYGYLTARGYLRLGQDYFHPVEYCIFQISGSDLTAYVCNAQCDEKRPCIQKCCGLTQSWDISEQRCEENNNTKSTSFWKPAFYSQVAHNCVVRVNEMDRLRIHTHVREGVPDCYPKALRMFSRHKIKNVVTERYRMLTNGTVISKDHHGGWNAIRPSFFCVDSIQDSSLSFKNVDRDQIVLACEGEFVSKIMKKPIPLRYAAILLTAAGFLVVTTIVFLLLWDKHNIYNWTIFCEVVAMFFMIVLVGIAHTFAREPESDDYGSNHCVYIGATAHFFYLTTFFWLTMINFDLFYTFRNLKPVRGQSKGWFRFSMYQLFGWGIPLVITVIGLILDSTYGIQNSDGMDCTQIIVPNYGQLNCYLSKAAQGPYLYYPIGVLLGGNLIFFIMTVVTVYKLRKSTQAVIRGRSTNNTKPLIVFGKLFIVMGVAWIFEIVSWAFHTKLSFESSHVPWYWVIFDVVTLVQAIAIFYMFVWKRQVLSQLWHKYPSFKPFLAPLTRLPCCGLIPQETNSLTVRGRMSKAVESTTSSENIAVQT